MTEPPRRLVPDSLREILRERDVTSVAMIDDAFDPPRVEELDADKVAEFYHAVSDSDEMREVVERLGIDPESLQDLSDEHLVLLHEADDALGPLAPIWESLAGGLVRDKLTLVEALRAMLQEELDLDVQALGVEEAEQFEPGSASIVFVDYFMGGPVDGPIRARHLISELVERHREANVMVPLIVLMSSGNLSDTAIEDFRQSTGILGGLYQFIRKDELVRPEVLFLRMGVLAESIPNAQRLQAFTDAVDQSLEGVRVRFMDVVRALTLEDYAYIQMLALQGDGHPLGDYMVWLFTAVLGDLAFGDAAVMEQQKQLDAMTFTSFAPSQHGPSPVLANMYHSAQFRNVDDVGTHPRDLDGAPAKRDEVYVHMGDVYSRPDSEEMWALITADCDLAFAPDHEERPFPGRRSAKLLPGKREELGQPLTEADRGRLRTEIFRDGEHSYRISWDPKRVLAFPLEQLRAWLDDGWSRRYRLRQPFALELQRGYAADSTRIGMPVPPPFYERMRAQILAPGASGRIEYLTESLDGEVITFVAGEHTYYVFTDAFVQRLLELTATAATMLSGQRDVLGTADDPDKKRRGRLKRRIEVLETHAADVGGLLSLRGKHRQRGKSTAPIRVSDLITLYPGTITGNQYQFDTPLAVQVSPVPGDETTQDDREDEDARPKAMVRSDPAGGGAPPKAGL